MTKKTNFILESTGTLHGIHTLMELAYGCPRKAYLKAIDNKDKDALVQKEYKSEALLSGVMWHAFREIANRAQLAKRRAPNIEDINLILPDDTTCEQFLWEKCLATAQRLEEQYRKQHPCLNYRILAVEKELELTAAMDNNTPLPVPYTGRMDLVIKVTKRQAKNLSDLMFLMIEPGIYLLDYKSMGRADPISVAKNSESLQGLAYLEAYNHGKAPKDQAKGMLYIFGTRTTRPLFMYGLQKYDATYAMQRLGALATEVQGMWPLDEYVKLVEAKKAPMPKTNPMRCYDFFRHCSYGYLRFCNGV